MINNKFLIEIGGMVLFTVIILGALLITLVPFKEKPVKIEEINLTYLEKNNSLDHAAFVGKSKIQGESVLFYVTKTEEGGNYENYVPEKDSTVNYLKKRSESPTLIVYEIVPENGFFKLLSSLFKSEKYKYEFNIHSDFYVEGYLK